MFESHIERFLQGLRDLDNLILGRDVVIQNVLQGGAVLQLRNGTKTVFFSGLRISFCLSLTGFLFEDNKTSKRWVNDNGEIIYGLPLWYENIGYVLYLNGIIDIDYCTFVLNGFLSSKRNLVSILPIMFFCIALHVNK